MVRVASPPMDESALDRAKQRIAAAADGHPHPADLSVALDRSREQIEALAATAAELEASIPAQVGHAVRDGLRSEVLPVARHIAEIRGLFNQAIRRLERIEGELLAERSARVDDLALLVDLVSSGWRGVDRRLARIEDAHAETSASLDGLVESLVAEDDDDAAPAVIEPDTHEPVTPDSSTPESAPPATFGPGFPAQGSQADAIVERAGTGQNGADRAAAAA
jgi:cation diffusion facilitator CzcD-associated flavoprotein CzcO